MDSSFAIILFVCAFVTITIAIIAAALIGLKRGGLRRDRGVPMGFGIETPENSIGSSTSGPELQQHHHHHHHHHSGADASHHHSHSTIDSSSAHHSSPSDSGGGGFSGGHH
jgi:hypothetical protein